MVRKNKTSIFLIALLFFFSFVPFLFALPTFLQGPADGWNTYEQPVIIENDTPIPTSFTTAQPGYLVAPDSAWTFVRSVTQSDTEGATTFTPSNYLDADKVQWTIVASGTAVTAFSCDVTILAARSADPFIGSATTNAAATSLSLTRGGWTISEGGYLVPMFTNVSITGTGTIDIWAKKD